MSDPTPPDDRLDAVVDGNLAPENLAERRLRELADSARSAATPKELAALDSALVAFAAHQREVMATATAVFEPGATWSRRMLARLRPSVRVGAAAAVLVVLGAGTAAAATTGQLPTPLQHLAHSTLGAPEPVRHQGHHHGAVAAASAHHSAKAVSHPTHSPSAKPSPSSTGQTAEPKASHSPDPSGSPQPSHPAWGSVVVHAHPGAHHAHHRLGHHQKRHHHATKRHHGSNKPRQHRSKPGPSPAPSSSTDPSTGSSNHSKH